MKIIHRIKNIRVKLLFISFISVFIYSLNPKPVHTTSAEMITKVNEVLEISLPSDNILLNLNPTETSVASGEQDYNIIVATNHIAGYNLILSANSTDLTRTKQHQSEPSATIPTVAETAEGYTTPNDFDVNHWGFKLGSNNYNAFKTSQLIGKSTGPVKNDEINLKFASKVNFSQPAGTYNLTINFNATANIITGVEGIVFNGNGADNPDAMPPQMITAPGANLNPNQFMRDGYVFAGWNTEADGSGMEYEDGVNYTIAEDGILKTAVLYAQWGRPIKILTTMQEMTSINCSVSAENETKQLRDTRDGKYYWVAKLKDGNCWMTQNLDLDIPTEGLRVVDTDILADWNSSSVYPPTATAKGNASTDKSLQVATGTNSYDPGDFVITKPGSWYDCATGDDTLDGGWGCANVATRISDNYTADYDASTGGIMTSDTVTVSGAKYDAHYHVGNYYQFNTATAGTGAALTDEDGEGAVAAGSICPKGWKLPLSGGVYDQFLANSR